MPNSKARFCVRCHVPSLPQEIHDNLCPNCGHDLDKAPPPEVPDQRYPLEPHNINSVQDRVCPFCTADLFGNDAIAEFCFRCGHHLPLLESGQQETPDKSHLEHLATVLSGMRIGDNDMLINNPDGTVDAIGGIQLHKKKLDRLPCLFKNVSSDFDCSENHLTTLHGAPQIVGGTFNCSFNKLATLQFGPMNVGGGFDCSFNQLSTLEFCPEKIGGSFDCRFNPISSFHCFPKEIGGTIEFALHPAFDLKSICFLSHDVFQKMESELLVQLEQTFQMFQHDAEALLKVCRSPFRICPTCKAELMGHDALGQFCSQCGNRLPALALQM